MALTNALGRVPSEAEILEAARRVVAAARRVVADDALASVFGKPAPLTLPSIPDWVVARQSQAANALAFQPPKRDKALPLDPDQISNALGEHWSVIETRCLDGLDVWFVRALRRDGAPDDVATMWQIILYEHMGEWLCSSIIKTEKIVIAVDKADGPDITGLTVIDSAGIVPFDMWNNDGRYNK